ncbi:MAG: hypothetical protein AUI14_13630 [Actinobacteria bacterium 13_2_20CM_2_71_6]|nr:MAG: hypothetical protein AUI14_13630 [Actinobacteria bacterium 13_2_20CM_2_71_6]
MTSPRLRTIAITAAAAVAVTVTMGCGILSAAGNLANNISAIGDLADKINKSEQLTYQADYRLDDGSTVTVAQQPPDSADVSDKGRFISRGNVWYLCDKSTGSWVCERTSTEGATPGSAPLAAGMAGNGFISAPMAVAVLTAAAIVPHAKVEQSSDTIAGQKSTCAKVSNLEQAQQNETEKLKDFTVCITESGVLARFSGTATAGTKAKVELTKYATTVDPALFQPPAGAKINDVDQLTNTPGPTKS